MEKIQIKADYNVLNEKLLKTESYAKAYKCMILSKRKSIVLSTLSLDYGARVLNILTEGEISININFSDLLGFIPLKEKEEDEIRLSLKKLIPKKNIQIESVNDEKSKISQDIEDFINTKNCRIVNLNFFPLFTVNKCNCCGWICCKCKETISERRAKNLELAFDKNELPEIHLEVYKIIMGERTTLTKEIDVNKKRKYLLYVNPVGGSGAALRIWNRVKNLFSISDIEIQVFKTQHYKHAFEHTLDMNFRKYDGIICCSGDGIVHEVINAICHREDREEFVHSVPIGVLPGGTSNGLAKVICESSGENCTPENCAYIISKGFVKEMDLLECELLSEDKKIFAFLSVAWGIIADIDLESEVCRCCGPFRYSLYGAFRWMCLRKTFAAVYHLPQDSLLEDKEIPSLRSPIDDTIFTRENEQFYYFLACNVSHIGESIHCAPRAKIDDGFIDLIKMKKQGGKRNLLKQLFNQDSGDYFTTNGDLKQGSGLEYVKTKAFRIVPKNNLEEDDNPTENRNLPFFYSIDGERYPVEPLQVKVLRKAIKIFCLNK